VTKATARGERPSCDASRARIASNKRAKGRAARSDFTLAREYTEANCDQEQYKVGNDRYTFGWRDAVCAVSLGVGCFTSTSAKSAAMRITS
jgi:hypothetical protein